MSNPPKKLTDKFISTLMPSEKPVDYWDSDIKGFVLRVFPTGVKTFRFSYRANGTRKTYTIGKFGTLTTTQARETAKLAAGQVALGVDIQQERIAARTPSNDEIFFKDFVEGSYYEWRKANRKNPEETIQRLKTCFYEDFAKVQLKEFSILMVETWKTKRLNAGIKPDTVNRDIADLRAVLSKAIDWEILETHPLKRLKQSKVDKTPLIRFLDDREKVSLRQALIQRDEKIRQERISANEWRASRGQNLSLEIRVDHYADHMHPMILLSLNTGLRQGELFSLRWEDVNFSTRMLSIRGAEAKSSQTRHVPLNKESLSVLETWQRQNGGISSGLLFASPVTGEEFDNVRKAWANILEAAEIVNFRWHDMRHHFASSLVMAGVDLNTVRELLGHADLKTTLRYAHLAPQHKSRAVDLISV